MIVSRSVAVFAAVVFYFISLNLKYLEVSFFFLNRLLVDELRSDWLDFVMHFIALLGFESFFLVLFALAWAPSIRHRSMAGRLALTLTEGFWVQSVFKVLFGRPRPPLASGDGGASARGELFSFPSGHAFGSTAGWLFIFLAIVPRLPWLARATRLTSPRRAWLAAFTMVGLVGFCRVYFAVHFLHDVVGGCALGLVYLHVSELLFPEPTSAYQARAQLIGHVAMAIAMLCLNYSPVLRPILLQHSASGVHFGPWLVCGFAAGLFFSPTNKGHKNEWSGKRIFLCFCCAAPMILLIITNKLLLPKDAVGGTRVPKSWIENSLVNLGTLCSGIFVFAVAPRILAKFT